MGHSAESIIINSFERSISTNKNKKKKRNITLVGECPRVCLCVNCVFRKCSVLFAVKWIINYEMFDFYTHDANDIDSDLQKNLRVHFVHFKSDYETLLIAVNLHALFDN